MIVTIDGPAGSGKSTAARRLAERLGFRFLDTGAMYRAVALACLRAGVDLEDHAGAAEIVRSVRVGFRDDRVTLNGEDVGDAIRTPEVTHGSSVVAVIPEVRSAMVDLQRHAAEGHDIVTEGRDQGTVVFPRAEIKFYVTAAPEVRARRRHRELELQGTPISYDDLLADILDRDERDANRKVGPLRAAEDAIQIDTSALEADEVIDVLEANVRRRQSIGPK
jgi:cytidylate kinase